MATGVPPGERLRVLAAERRVSQFLRSVHLHSQPPCAHAHVCSLILDISYTHLSQDLHMRTKRSVREEGRR